MDAVIEIEDAPRESRTLCSHADAEAVRRGCVLSGGNIGANRLIVINEHCQTRKGSFNAEFAKKGKVLLRT